jgi:hypothetical protein
MSTSPAQGWARSSPGNPCPICGRDDRDGDCRIHSDSIRLICHYGQSLGPPGGMKPGDALDGKDGQRWAFTGRTTDDRGAHFTLDKPREAGRDRSQSAGPSPFTVELARLPKPGKLPPDHWPDGQTLNYSWAADRRPTQWVEVIVPPGAKKQPKPRHLDGNGQVVRNAGPGPWPLWLESDALQHGPGKWISEAEGEKCAAWLGAGGLVAVSQPGHDHKPDAIKARYRRLKEAGIIGIAYLADADSTGTQKAKRCADAALAAGLKFLTIRAQDVWPVEMAPGGSIDDAWGTATERATKFEDYVRGLKPQDSQATREEDQRPAKRYRELLDLMLEAVISGNDDDLMELRADAITRFRRTDAQVEAALFDLHRQRQISGGIQQQPEALDLSRISGMDWLIEGFVPDNDMTLIWGDAGSGKTTAALAAACSVLLGTGLLDHSQPAPKRSVLFIASDSGAPPLYATMQDMGLADLPEVKQGPDQRFFVWASDAEQGMSAWAADLRGCINLLEFVKRRQIGLVLIDSCKAVCKPSTGLDYTSNQMVTSLLTYFKDVICPHTAVVWLNHDGTANGAHAGAKAWKEIPSMVHRIRREEKKDGAKTNNRRRWDVTKSRMGPTREFFYQLSNGTLAICPEQEVVGNCLAQVVEALTNALRLQGLESLSRSELQERICMVGRPSTKTLDNTLSTATRAKHPEVCRVAGKRGHYKLAPRVASLLKGRTGNGKEQDQTSLPDCVSGSSRHVPAGTQGEAVSSPGKFPGKNAGNSSDPLPDVGSEQFSSLLPCTPITGADQSMAPVGSGADAFDADDDPAWGPRRS